MNPSGVELCLSDLTALRGTANSALLWAASELVATGCALCFLQLDTAEEKLPVDPFPVLTQAFLSHTVEISRLVESALSQKGTPLIHFGRSGSGRSAFLPVALSLTPQTVLTHQIRTEQRQIMTEKKSTKWRVRFRATSEGSLEVSRVPAFLSL